MPKHHLAIRQFIAGLTLAVLLLGSSICSARAAQAQDGTPLPDGFGTLLPAGVTAKTIVQLIAPGNDASLATLVGMKAWPYQKDTYVAIACFASNKEFHDKAMQYNDGKPKCWGDGALFDDKNGVREPWNVYLAVLRFGGTDTIPKVVATYGKPLDVNLDKGHSDLDMPDSGGYPDAYDRFDFANYKISNNAVAFGIRGRWDESDGNGGSGGFESIMLFSINAGHIINILSEPICYKQEIDIPGKDGVVNVNLYEGQNIVSILPHTTNGIHDLQLKTKGKNWKQDFSWNEQELRYDPIYPNPSLCLAEIGANHNDVGMLKPQFIYTRSATYCVNQKDGAPIQIHGPVQNHDDKYRPISIIGGPAGFVYLMSLSIISGSNSISAYHIDDSTGELTAVPGSSLETGHRSVGVMVNPAGTFAYVVNLCNVNCNGSISVYGIDGTTKVLKPVPGNPFAAGMAPSSIAINPAGIFAYVVNEGYYGDKSNISAYHIDITTGVLKPLPGSPFAAGIRAGSIAINPAGTFAYVVNESNDGVNGKGSISVFHIDATTGVLKPLPGGAFAVGIDAGPIAINPAGTFAYVINGGRDDGDGSLSAFRIDATTGALTPVPGSPFATGNTPTSIVFNPAGTFVYVGSLGDVGFRTIVVYRINTKTGVLTQIHGSPFVVTDSSQLIIAR